MQTRNANGGAAEGPGGAAPVRVLGAWDATSVVIGAIIGVGIFFTPSKVAKLTASGDLALAAWVLAGGIAMCGGLTFAALGRRYHASGAQYQVLRDAYGTLAAFLFVFCNATAIQAGAIGAIALICAKNLVALAGMEAGTGTTLGVALGLIGLLTGANIVGVKWGARVQNLTVAAKVLALLGIVGLAIFGGSNGASAAGVAGVAAPSAALPGISGVLAALVPAFFAYGGWQHALWISGEVKEPARNLPRAIIVGIVVVIVVYVAANWAYLRLLGHAGVAASGALAADAVGVVLPGWGRRAIAAAVAISALGVLNAQLLSGPRLVYGMAMDGRFFKSFGVLHARFRTPIAAIALLGGLGAALLAVVGEDGIGTLIAGPVFVDSIFFVLTGAALLILGRRRGAGGGFGVLSTAAAIVFVLGEVGVLIGASLAPDFRQAVVGGLAWIVGAACVYAIWFRRGAAPKGV